MNKYCVSQRLNWYKRTKGPALVRDIAWAQLCVPDLLEKFEIQPLTTQQLSIVKQIYKHQGGLAEAEHLYLRDEQIVRGEDGIWSISNEAYYGVPEADEASQEDQEPPTKKVKIEGNEEDDGDSKKDYTPNRNLRAKYGVLDMDYDEPVLVKEESPNIPADQIPIGLFRNDPAPARLITATLDPADQNIYYTVQPIDRDFVKVKLHEGHLVENGTSWPSDGNQDKDTDTVIFVRALQEMDYDEVRRYVFRELRKEGQFDNLWTSFEDMLEHPGLLLMADMVSNFTAGGKASGVDEQAGLLDQREALLKVMDALTGLEARAGQSRQRLRAVDKESKDSTLDDGEKQVDLREMTEGIWNAMGQTFRVMLASRRDGAGA